jgi:protein-L-isoaspartate(D-aspartate) O-methyltransferase
MVPQAIIEKMARVPRELFVPLENRHMAYLNIPLSIGEDQTISQPYMVALMLDALELKGKERVLDVGTGSGYQAAILSELLPGGRVVSVERLAPLRERADRVLTELGYANVTVEPAGRTLGAPHDAPFDAIVVGAAAPRIPQSLVSQLAPGGRLVVPVGSREGQHLVQVCKTDEGLSVRWYGPCRFVPLVGEEGFPER